MYLRIIQNGYKLGGVTIDRNIFQFQSWKSKASLAVLPVFFSTKTKEEKRKTLKKKITLTLTSEFLYWFVWEEGFLWTLCKTKLCNKPNFCLLLLIVESPKGDTVTLLNSGIFIFGEHYLNLLNRNVQKVARITSSYRGKINPSKFKEEFCNVNKLSGHKTNDLLSFDLLICQCLKRRV